MWVSLRDGALQGQRLLLGSRDLAVATGYKKAHEVVEAAGALGADGCAGSALLLVADAERVQRGERITITRRGKPVAVLGPPPSEKPDVKKVIEDFKAFAKGRSLGDISIRELIDEGRRF